VLKEPDLAGAPRQAERHLPQTWFAGAKLDLETAGKLVRPVLYPMRPATGWRPKVRGLKLQVNSI
jgi:hypothetical protein